jgi:hypothetical protein
MADKNNTKSQKGGPMATGNESRPDKPVNEKSSVGGKHNSGVTSHDPAVKEHIEKQATMGKHQPDSHNENEQKGLTKEELPDATNESTGKMGSGQRQDSN